MHWRTGWRGNAQSRYCVRLLFLSERMEGNDYFPWHEVSQSHVGICSALVRISSLNVNVKLRSDKSAVKRTPPKHLLNYFTLSKSARLRFNDLIPYDGTCRAHSVVKAGQLGYACDIVSPKRTCVPTAPKIRSLSRVLLRPSDES